MKGARMAREFRARFSKGKIEPLVKVDLREGEEFTITIKEEEAAKGAFERAAGGWKNLVDTDALLNDFKESRKTVSPEVQL
jgi:predicted DNA-binding antitoxin AbrB/MazE fold protein